MKSISNGYIRPFSIEENSKVWVSKTDRSKDKDLEGFIQKKTFCLNKSFILKEDLFWKKTLLFRISAKLYQ